MSMLFPAQGRDIISIRPEIKWHMPDGIEEVKVTQS